MALAVRRRSLLLAAGVALLGGGAFAWVVGRRLPVRETRRFLTAPVELGEVRARKGPRRKRTFCARGRRTRARRPAAAAWRRATSCALSARPPVTLADHGPKNSAAVRCRHQNADSEPMS